MLKTSIRNIFIHNFRSIKDADIRECGNLNIFIGRNNAGKSNVLSTITLALSHFRHGEITSSWRSSRAAAEFYGKDTTAPILIGIEFELPKATNDELRQQLKREAPQLDRAIDDLVDQDTLAFIVKGDYNNGSPFLYVQDMAVGTVVSRDGSLATSGFSLLHVELEAAKALEAVNTNLESKRRDAATLDELLRRGVPEFFFREKEVPVRYLFRDRPTDISRELEALLLQARRIAPSMEQFTPQIAQSAADLRDEIAKIELSPIAPMRIFSGETRTTPPYIKWLLERYGSIELLHLTENKTPIGRREADQLLNLKVRRGGPERLRAVQNTVENLLGVKLDAFQSESGRDQAEMDVDDFLAEANGAGIREALRLILDLELKTPSLVLLEEPEVHLHPGLEYAVHSYLQEKSRDAQFFVTTHSTNFVDFVAFQNVYLVSRDSHRATRCARIEPGEAPLRISEELGLRLSTVFMYDRLVFVEGPSDELVLREFARNLDLDLVRANVGFVHMRGVKNFAHYAAHHTLDLLTKRQVKMWFIADRDELNDEEVKAMAVRLGAAATMKVLKRRELENYLLCPDALARFVADKLSFTKDRRTLSKIQITSSDLQDAAASLKDTVISLRLTRAALPPVYPANKAYGESHSDRLQNGIKALQDRLDRLAETKAEIERSVEQNWPGAALDLAPGSEILDVVCGKFGVRFKKDDGDSARLARYVGANVPDDMKAILSEISSLPG